MDHLKCINLLTLILTPNLPNEFCTKVMFTFVEELKEVSINDKFLVSCDVNSLFTSIPLKETIKLAVDLIKISYPNLKISSDNLTKLFKFATCETFFLQWKILLSDRWCSYGISSRTSFSQSFHGR